MDTQLEQCISNSLNAGIQFEQKKLYLIRFAFILIIFFSEWSNWGDWSTCTKTCGGGEQIRNRACEVPSLKISLSKKSSVCPGDSTEKRTCNKNSCPGNLLYSN